jgi:hypothetical protein
MPNTSDNQDNITNLTEQLKEAKQHSRKADKEAKKQRKKADTYSGVEDWLADTPMYYIGQLDRFVVQDDLGGWAFLKSSALPRIYPILSDTDAMEALPTAMEEAKRAFLYCTYAFKEYPQTLNLMDASNWLKPKAGKHHWAFDVLMRSLGSGKAANVEHIQKVLTYKYLHPDSWRLPCLLFFGEGGVGKNLLVDLVLYTIFNHQTISATSDNLVSTFNSLLKGRVAVLINETVVGKHDNAKLTNLLNKERIEINEKGVPQYGVDNTPLYLIGSNDWNGGALLDRSDADRRLSVMRCEKAKTLKYWLAQHMGVNEQEANEWLKNGGGKIFGDPVEIAKWLHHLIETFGTCDLPDALHGADYEGLMDIQEQTDERIARAVFMADDFDYISAKDLYEGYICCCKETGNRFPVKDKTFNRRIELWLEGNLPTVVKQTHKQNYYLPGNNLRDPKTRKQREKTVWINPTKSGNPDENNRDKYFYDDGPTPPKWKLEI